jgi:hypothetical protein
VLQGDTLAPYLFIIVLDFILRIALDSQSTLGVLLKRGNRRYPSTYLTDLDFADDIALFSELQENVQIMLNYIERVALKVGLKINRMKTEFLLIGKWDASVSLTISSGPIKKVDDFKYLGSWLMDCGKDFRLERL